MLSRPSNNLSGIHPRTKGKEKRDKGYSARVRDSLEFYREAGGALNNEERPEPRGLRGVRRYGDFRGHIEVRAARLPGVIKSGSSV